MLINAYGIMRPVEHLLDIHCPSRRRTIVRLYKRWQLVETYDCASPV